MFSETTKRGVPDIVLIGGSPSRPSRSAAVLSALRCALPPQRTTAEIHVRDLPAEPLLRGDAEHSGLAEAVRLVTGARGVVVVSPVYKAAYSGALKTFLDLLPQDALNGKVVLPLASGGSPGHRLAIDYALKPVLASLGARHILSGVFVSDDQAPWNGTVGGDQDGVCFVLDRAVQDRLRRAADELDGALRALESRTRPASKAAAESAALAYQFGGGI